MYDTFLLSETSYEISWDVLKASKVIAVTKPEDDEMESIHVFFNGSPNQARRKWTRLYFRQLVNW